MRFVFYVVSDGDRQIRHADACRNFTVHQQIVFAQAVFAGFVFAETAVRAQSCRRGTKDQFTSRRGRSAVKRWRAALAPS